LAVRWDGWYLLAPLECFKLKNDGTGCEAIRNSV
jgi:hypothetical protein